MKESIICYSVRIFGAFIRILPLNAALGVGNIIGLFAYLFDTKHRSVAYANLKMAFSKTKSPEEIKQITKDLFINYALNCIDLLRMPLMTDEKFEKSITVEGKEHIIESLKKGNGAIFLAMHYGSWEMASLSCAKLGFPYKMMVKPQDRYSKLDDLLNSYRKAGGYEIVTRGMGTREFLNSLKNNEVVGMVVDQGGKDGVLVPLFGREAALSVGAIRMGLKSKVPLCFSVIYREGNGCHKMVIHEPLTLIDTGDLKADIVANLDKVTKLMEHYMHEHPSEYMWFYKIWKYSKRANILILNDGKTGHLRQSETVAQITYNLLKQREIEPAIQTILVSFKNKFWYKLFAIFAFFAHPFFHQGRLGFLKWFLTEDSYKQLMSTKAEFIISCGSTMAGINYLLSVDHDAKSIAILKPGIISYKRFGLVILPQHDVSQKEAKISQIAVTKAAPNLIDEEYLNGQSELLLRRFTHLQNRTKFKIGVFIGGDAKNLFLSENQIKVLINQIKGVSGELNADVLITTSRRTPARIEQLLQREFKNDNRCPLLILANESNVPEAVGGILGLSDIAVVSGDSISMVSEAASSGKYTVVFSPLKRDVILRSSNKHSNFVEKLNAQGFVLSSSVKDIGESIYGLAKNKIQTRKIDDNKIIEEALKYII